MTSSPQSLFAVGLLVMTTGRDRLAIFPPNNNMKTEKTTDTYSISHWEMTLLQLL
jgi:hypothetical protein